MFDYLKGIISEIYADSVVIDINGVGYKIYVPNPFSYEEGGSTKVYLYNHIKEEEYSLYGFKSKDDRDLFLKLLSVKGMGPKICLGLLATGSINGIADAINKENILYLKKFPKVGEKLARQMILDLKGKLAVDSNIYEDNTSHDDDLISALEVLGYKHNEIKRVIPLLNHEESLESQVKEALKLLLK